MPARDVAFALRRLIDSPWACRSLLAGDEYALAGLRLSEEERGLIVRDLDGSLDAIAEKLAMACIDPTLRDRGQAGIFFDAAQYALQGMQKEVADFEEFLTRLAIKVRESRLGLQQ